MTALRTLLVHPPAVAGEPTGASSTPIYQTATFVRPVAGEAAWDYSRSGNPTRDVLEQQLAALDGAARSLAYGAGVAALAAVLRLVPPGGRVVAGEDLYGGTVRLLDRLSGETGLVARRVDTRDLAAVQAALATGADLLLLETPSNPRLQETDVAAVAALAHRHGSLLAVDNSLLSSYLERPLARGADFAVQSATKLLGGHSDLTAGVVSVADRALGERLAEARNADGTALAPFEAWLLLRGLQTLPLRLERQLENARRLIACLDTHPGVQRLYRPPDPPGGVVISFETGSVEASRRLVSSLELFGRAVSFGGVRSTASLPAEMSHASIPASERARVGLTPDLVRLAVGIEDAEDLVADLRSALERAGEARRLSAPPSSSGPPW